MWTPLDAGGGGPNQIVDLVQLPAHVALAQGGAVIQHNLDTLIKVVAAELPAFKGGGQELNGNFFVTFLGQPVGINKNVVL